MFENDSDYKMLLHDPEHMLGIEHAKLCDLAHEYRNVAWRYEMQKLAYKALQEKLAELKSEEKLLNETKETPDEQ